MTGRRLTHHTLAPSLRRESLPRSTLDDRGTLLGDHERGRVDVGRGHRQHHRGINDPETPQARALVIRRRRPQSRATPSCRCNSRDSWCGRCAARSQAIRHRSESGCWAEPRRGRIASVMVPRRSAAPFATADDGVPVGLLGQIARLDRRQYRRAGSTVAPRRRASARWRSRR